MRWLLAMAMVAVASSAAAEVPLDASRFAVVERESGDTSYYLIVDGMIHAVYRPPLDTVVLGVELTEGERRAAHVLRWRWRALALPAGGNACVPGRGDNAAAVYVSWKRGLRWYVLKYVWTAEGAAGVSCRRKQSPFSRQETVVLAAGGPLATWREEAIDLTAAFREHFSGEPPELAGIAVMTDGDQTGSTSAADYADFRLAP